MPESNLTADHPSEVLYSSAAAHEFPDGPAQDLHPSEDNARRAGWAFAALRQFVDATYGGNAEAEPLAQVIGDLLVDLQHLADAFGLSWDELLRRAADHYAEETVVV